MTTALLIGWLAAQTCDLAVTNLALSSGRFVEGNPILGNSRTRLNTIKVSVNVLAFVAWHKNKEKKGSVIIPISMIATGATACAWNVKSYTRQ